MRTWTIHFSDGREETVAGHKCIVANGGALLVLDHEQFPIVGYAPGAWVSYTANGVAKARSRS